MLVYLVRVLGGVRARPAAVTAAAAHHPAAVRLPARPVPCPVDHYPVQAEQHPLVTGRLLSRHHPGRLRVHWCSVSHALPLLVNHGRCSATPYSNRPRPVSRRNAASTTLAGNAATSSLNAANS